MKFFPLIFLLILFSSQSQDYNRFKIFKNNNSFKLISPDGTPFFSLGITHVQALTYPDTMEIFKKNYKNNWDVASKDVAKNFFSWGFNTAGYGAPKQMRKLIPFLMPSQPLVNNSSWLENDKFSYCDIFDLSVQQEILKKIYKMTYEKNNSNLIGYYWTDMPMWNLEKSIEKFGTNWVIYIKSLPENSAGRKRYEKFKNEPLLDESLSFEENFLKLIARKYYKLIGEETRRLDPNTLIFGERYSMGRIPTYIIEEALPYIDVISIQPNGCSFDKNYFRMINQLTGKPIIICDHQCSFPTEKHVYTMWEQFKNQRKASNNYSKLVISAVNEPYLLGYHRCQYIDRFNKKKKLLKQGMVKENGDIYQLQAKIMSRLNQKVKKIFNERI